jgi:hypothetical protein
VSVLSNLVVFGVLGGNVGGCTKSKEKESKKDTGDDASQL